MYISHVAQVNDTAQVTGFIVIINFTRTRREISKHISIACNMLYRAMHIFVV